MTLVYCVNPKTMTTIISGMLLCYEEKANQMQDEKPHAVTVLSFVACIFFLWFDLPSDWS